MMDPLLLIITRSIIGNTNGSIITYYWPGQLGDVCMETLQAVACQQRQHACLECPSASVQSLPQVFQHLAGFDYVWARVRPVQLIERSWVVMSEFLLLSSGCSKLRSDQRRVSDSCSSTTSRGRSMVHRSPGQSLYSQERMMKAESIHCLNARLWRRNAVPERCTGLQRNLSLSLLPQHASYSALNLNRINGESCTVKHILVQARSWGEG